MTQINISSLRLTYTLSKSWGDLSPIQDEPSPIERLCSDTARKAGDTFTKSDGLSLISSLIPSNSNYLDTSFASSFYCFWL